MQPVNYLIPIAGKAQRFIDKGYQVPKPLIMADGFPIIERALASLEVSARDKFIFIVRRDHVQNFNIDTILKYMCPSDNYEIIVIDKITEGALCTCLLAKDLINNDSRLVIYTPDVFFRPKFNVNNIDESYDGFLLGFKANNPAHSYIQAEGEFVTKTAEKQIISSNAAVGYYYFKRGSDFVKYAEQMVSREIKTNNEYYICPIYNLLINDKLSVGCNNVEQMYVLGTPQDLEFFDSYTANTIKTNKKIAICSDHSGFELKQKIVDYLIRTNIEFVDFGCYTEKSCDYSDFVIPACRYVSNKKCDIGIGVCRTGQGVNIAANKQGGIMSALIHDTYTAKMAVKHNCANFFSIASKYLEEDIDKILSTILTNSFDSGRHMTRIKKFL